MSNYEKYLNEAENIDFNALGESWAAKTLPNEEKPIDYRERAETASREIKDYIKLIGKSDDIKY